MKMNDFMVILNDCCNDVTFSFDGKPAGIMPEVENYKKNYHVWFGDKTKDYPSAETLMNDKFFNGRALKEIFSKLDIAVS